MEVKVLKGKYDLIDSNILYMKIFRLSDSISKKFFDMCVFNLLIINIGW